MPLAEFATLLLLAFCARALIPAGFMPGPGGLVFCPGDAPMQGAATHAMLHDMSTMGMSSMDMSGMPVDTSQHSHHGGSSDHEGSSLCPFAAAAPTTFELTNDADGGATPLAAMHGLAQ